MKTAKTTKGAILRATKDIGPGRSVSSVAKDLDRLHEEDDTYILD